MRLADLIARLDRETIVDLATRIVPGADQLAPGLLPHKLEVVLAETGVVEQVVLASRPPTLSILLRLLDVAEHTEALAELREVALAEAHEWVRDVSNGELANRLQDHSGIYRRLLCAAWRDDHKLDSSETRILDLLRDELGLLRTEHFLLGHHDSILRFWESEDPVSVAVHELQDQGVLFVLGDQVHLPDELVPQVRKALGIELSRDAAKRLYARLGSGSHLREALEEHELRTGGSKSDRVDRLVANFVPPHSVLDAMHIRDVRELARGLGLQVTGAKAEVIARIVRFFSRGGDLAEPMSEELETLEREPRELSPGQFVGLLGHLKGRQLQQLLLNFGLRHSGSKDQKIRTLLESHLSETSILEKLQNKELGDLLSRLDLRTAGTKAQKIGRVLHLCRGQVDEADPDPGSQTVTEAKLDGAMGGVSDLLAEVDLRSTSSTRFEPMTRLLSEILDIEIDDVAVKFVPDSKNYGNRIAEALRGTPHLLVLLARPSCGEAVLEAARSRLLTSPRTHFVALCGDRAEWRCEGILCATRSPLLRRLVDAVPEAPVDLSGLPETYEWSLYRGSADTFSRTFSSTWAQGDLSVEDCLRQGLSQAMGSGMYVVRTKHVSAGRNLGNRISEALGAGCNGLSLFVPEELALRAKEEVSRQLAAARCPTFAVVMSELEDGGYGEPTVIGCDGRVFGGEPASEMDNCPER